MLKKWNDRKKLSLISHDWLFVSDVKEGFSTVYYNNHLRKLYYVSESMLFHVAQRRKIPKKGQ